MSYEKIIEKNDIGKERSAINLLMRWIILIPLLIVVGWFLLSGLEWLIPPSWYECYPSIC
jgi:hypothetical protein